MVNEIHSDIHPAGTAPDYARYDRIWQRVAPGQNPYPDVRASAPAAIPAAAMQPQSVIETPPQPAMPSGEITAAERREELMLPGAEADPCCMGSQAMEFIEVIEGYAQEELVDASTYRQLARLAPTRTAAAALRELGRAADQHARELSAAWYLITGETKQQGVASVILPRLPYRELLRERYHAAACNGLNYARTADSTEDYCLQKMMQRFSNENYAAADRLLHLLAQLR